MDYSIVGVSVFKALWTLVSVSIFRGIWAIVGGNCNNKTAKNKDSSIPIF